MIRKYLMFGAILLSCQTFVTPQFVTASSNVTQNNIVKNEAMINSQNSSAKDIVQKKIDNLINRKAIEIPSLRTSNEKHFVLPNGKYEAVISPYELHYLDENNEYQNINTTLVAENRLASISSKSKELIVKNKTETDESVSAENAEDGKSFRAPRVPFDVRVPQTFNLGYSISKGEDNIEFVPVESYDVIGSQTSLSTIFYKDAWENTDVSLEVQRNGIKETIVLKNDLSPKKISYEVIGDIDGNLTSDVFSILPAWLVDAKGTKRVVNQQLRETDNKKYIDLEIDAVGLTYPITIDPTTITSTISGVENGKVYTFDVPKNATNISASATVTSQDYSKITSVSKTGTTTSSSGTVVPASNVNTAFSITNINVTATITNTSGSSPGDPPGQTRTTEPSDVGITSTTTTCFSKDFASSYASSTFEAKYTSIFSGGIKNHCELFVNGVSNASVNAPLGVLQSTGIKLNIAQNISLVNGSFKLNNGSTSYTVGNLSGAASKVIPLGTGIIPGTNSIAFSAASGSKANIVISVTYTLVTQLVSPNGGETVDASTPIQWLAGEDQNKPQSSLQYQIQLSGDNGVTWKDLLSLTPPGDTSATIDFRTIAPTTTALIRIRSFNGTTYGAWDESDAVFSVRHLATTYEYDQAGRLANVYLTSGKKITYTYDSNGNLISKVVS
ncbi:YD repeat-containing protein [Paenibacillus sp. UNC496MF]|uniref:RHS repeat protein n=1 Tax=Paenibacillus sp. UNC496MF TaxID=1502753 RepID=UPI0008E5EE16|nr:RHS repeat domain-containing protein [Paenibacillus sp. UNC496MF]SFJ76061.1 YD repeat-containing protein [Paenibacillus sp. UNC496MF]